MVRIRLIRSMCMVQSRRAILIMQHASLTRLVNFPSPQSSPLKIHFIGADRSNALPGLLVEFEARACDWVDVQEIHLIDLLECLARGFNEEEEDEDKGSEIAARKDVAVCVLDITCDERREECEHEVPEPVG